MVMSEGKQFQKAVLKSHQQTTCFFAAVVFGRLRSRHADFLDQTGTIVQYHRIPFFQGFIGI